MTERLKIQGISLITATPVELAGHRGECLFCFCFSQLAERRFNPAFHTGSVHPARFDKEFFSIYPSHAVVGAEVHGFIEPLQKTFNAGFESFACRPGGLTKGVVQWQQENHQEKSDFIRGSHAQISWIGCARANYTMSRYVAMLRPGQLHLFSNTWERLPGGKCLA